MLDLACHVNVALPALDDERLPATLHRLRAAGYRRVVLGGLRADAAQISRVGRIVADAGLRPIAMSRQWEGANVAADDAEQRAAGLAALRDQILMAVDVGADHLTGLAYGLFGTGAGPTSAVSFARTAKLVGEAAELASEADVIFSCEVLNRYETSLMNTAEQARRFADASGSEHLLLHLDTFHLALEEQDLIGAIADTLPRLAYLELGQSGRGSLARGVVPIAEVVSAVVGLGYEGRWGFEAFSRSVLRPGTADALSIWRSPYDDGIELAEEAAALVLTA